MKKKTSAKFTFRFYRLRSTGGFNLGLPPELKYHSDTEPARAMTKITPTTASRNAIFTVFLRAKYATKAMPRNTSKNATATTAPITLPLGAISNKIKKLMVLYDGREIFRSRPPLPRSSTPFRTAESTLRRPTPQNQEACIAQSKTGGIRFR